MQERDFCNKNKSLWQVTRSHTELLHVLKNPGTYFWPNRGRSRQLRRLNRAITWHTSPRNIVSCLVWRKKRRRLPYPRKMKASNICLRKGNKLLQQRKWKSGFWGEWRLWPAKTHVTVQIFMNHEMIPRSGRTFCHMWFPTRPWQRIFCLQKCSLSILQITEFMLATIFDDLNQCLPQIDDWSLRNWLGQPQGPRPPKRSIMCSKEKVEVLLNSLNCGVWPGSCEIYVSHRFWKD